ncbi:unnamed protein product [Vicia faba]|uniref:Peptidase A1 domain-containing protein n=1 Tax=Vicia faba TaxID=3906 RepID=A0AAV0ZZS2_VICFA|nr:unnamed protein product [Vicia faba]
MRFSIPTLLFSSLICCLLSFPVSAVYSTGYLPLQRAVPLSHRVEIHTIKARDRLRHNRFFRDGGGVVDFTVQGSSDPFTRGYGLYTTKVKMGNPPKEFNVQIDTGSDILWVNCNTCSNCPKSSGIGIELNFFDTVASSTAAMVRCSDPVCTYGVQGAAAQCSPQSTSDNVNSSAAIVFGCSTSQSGDLTKTDKAVDGIFGFGPGDLSVVSQLSSRGITPKVFSHCLKGDGNGGGILVLGEILEPSIVYSPLVPSQPHYNLNLLSIAVNGQLLSINPDVFTTSDNRGTIVDCGTTLAYLVQEAYDPLVNAVNTAVSRFATPFISKGSQCYLVLASIDAYFPPVSLNFAGGASMDLKPSQYLLHNGYQDGAAMWCIGFQKVQEGVTILGDLVLKDKIVVYDLARQQIGWTNYDCSTSVNVSVTTTKDEYINARARQTSVCSSKIGTLSKLLPLSIMAISIHIIIFMKSPHL